MTGEIQYALFSQEAKASHHLTSHGSLPCGGAGSFTLQGSSTMTVGVIVMPCYRSSLHQLLEDGARMSVSRRLRIAIGIFAALAYLHALGIVHGDVKVSHTVTEVL